jgi:hypothetical protein
VSPRRPLDEPPWCVKTDHDGRPSRHLSREFHVGDRYRLGEVVTCLCRAGDGETRLLVIAVQGSSFTADLSLEEARRLREHLDALIRLAEIR